MAVLCSDPSSVRQHWIKRRAISGKDLDEVLWQLHTTTTSVPSSIFDAPTSGSESEVSLQIGVLFRDTMRVMRTQSWNRQEGLRWMDPKVYSASVNASPPLQKALDELHSALDIIRLSCKLLQQVIIASRKVKLGDSAKSIDITILIKHIPANKRSDLANRLLDLYQRLAVLWSKNFSVHGLPVAFKQPPELLQLLTFDLPNFQVDQIYQQIFVAKKIK